MSTTSDSSRGCARSCVCPECHAALARRAGPTGRPSCAARPPSAAWPTGSTTASRCCSSTRPGAPAADASRRCPTRRGAARRRGGPAPARLAAGAARAGHRRRPGARGRHAGRRGRRRAASAAGDRPRSVLVASLGGSAVVGRRARAAGRPGVTGAGHGAAQPAAARVGRPARPGRRGVAVGPGRRPARAGRRGRPPRRGLLTVGADDSPLAEVSAPGPRGARAVGRGRPSSRTALWSLLAPVLAGGRRARAGRRARRRSSRRSPTGWTTAEAVRPVLRVVRQPGQGRSRCELAERGAGRPRRRRPGRGRGRAGRGHAGPHRPDARDLGRAARRRAPGRRLLRRPVHRRGAPGGTGRRRHLRRPVPRRPARPALRLLLLRDAPPEPTTPTARGRAALADAVADRRGRRRAGRSEHVDRCRAPAGAAGRALVALTDFASAYLALGPGFDPAVRRTSPTCATSPATDAPARWVA